MTTITNRQRDFSGGQINKASWRNDEAPEIKKGARTCLNWRVDTKQLYPRPGRRPVFIGSARQDYLRMAASYEFFIGFGAGKIVIYSVAGVIVASSSSSSYLWTDGTAAEIVVAQATNDIIITFPNMQPQVVSWNRASNSWSFAAFAFSTNGGGFNAPFYRQLILGATMSYSGKTGQVTLLCSAAFFTTSMVGAVLSIMGQQVQIASVNSSVSALANCLYSLPAAITVPVDTTAPFALGDVVVADYEAFKFEVTSIDAGGLTVTGVLRSDISFQSVWNGKDASGNWDKLTSATGTANLTAAPSEGSLPQATTEWAEQFMSADSGWPSSCFYDRQRVGFCGFPQKQEAVLWGAIGDNHGFWIDDIAAANNTEAGTAADAAFLEFVVDAKGNAPGVKHVVGWGDEFVFTDRGIFQVPIDATNPLKPGSVEFRQISNDGCSALKPLPQQDAIIYINKGLNRCSVVRATGAYSRPYITQDVADLYTDIFNNPVTFGVTVGDNTFPERYVYVVNSDGTLAVGKFEPNDSFIGWVPWQSVAPVKWVTVADSDVYYTSLYGSSNVVEIEDSAVYQDASILLNADPVVLQKSGYGPFWFYPGGTVTLMDGNRDLGDRAVDALGNVVPIAGEDLSSVTLTAGIFTPCLWQPLVPAANSGQTEGQGRRKRKIARAVAHVANSNGFRLGKRTFSCDRFGADATAQPVLVDGAFRGVGSGREDNPTIDFAKDRPGPIILTEFVTEATV